MQTGVAAFMKNILRSALVALATVGFLVFPACNGDDPAGSKSDPKSGSAESKQPETKQPESKQPETKQPETKPKAKPSGSKRKYGAEDYRLARAQVKTFCVTCHGTKGKGDGPAGLALNPKPRDWTDKKWQKEVTDQELFNVIKDGGAKHGKSPMMAPNPMYGDKPKVLWGLVAIVRSYGK